MGPGQGCSEAARCAQGAASRPPRAAAVSREQPEGPVPAPSTENKSAACSRPVFKARKVGATRALPGVVVVLAPTLLGMHGEQCRERHVPLPRCAGDTRGNISPAPKRSGWHVAVRHRYLEGPVLLTSRAFCWGGQGDKCLRSIGQEHCMALPSAHRAPKHPLGPVLGACVCFHLLSGDY